MMCKFLPYIAKGMCGMYLSISAYQSYIFIAHKMHAIIVNLSESEMPDVCVCVCVCVCVQISCPPVIMQSLLGRQTWVQTCYDRSLDCRSCVLLNVFLIL